MNTRSLSEVRLAMQAGGQADQLLLVAPDGRCWRAEAIGDAQGMPMPASVDDLLQSGSPIEDDAVLQAWRTVAAGDWNGPGLVESPRYAPLFRRPRKILCVGQNFRRHAQEMGAGIPKWPVLFSKFDNTLSAPDGVVQLPPPDIAFKYDYETELVVVIGSRIDAGTRDPMACVAGYCIGHDLTARDLQRDRGGQWLLGKTLDGFAPIGPDFVGARLAGDSNAMAIETRRNGAVVQSSSTADFIFPVQAVLSYVAHHFTLEPGDLVFTGTPEGVIAGKPAAQQDWLKAGDRIESRVGDLGVLRFSLG